MIDVPDETDYLVIGAGAMGMAFADELFTRTDAHITLVDRRDAPGGHWNDVYPFVRLHQPASFYGVESRELATNRIETHGPNAGFMELSEGPQIVHYFHAVLNERLLPSGRVSFVPMSEVEPGGVIRHRLSGRRHTIRVRRKTVDASWHTNVVPATHTPAYSIAPGVTCVPPNELPRRAARHSHHVVLGGGKTGIDACVWLITNGASPEGITWVVPRDSWFWNRARQQPSMPFFDSVFGGIADLREACAVASSMTDLAHRLEACGMWLRLDPSIEPSMFHYATVSDGELAMLRSIDHTVRQGRVRAVEPGRLVLQGGDLRVPADSLVVDCTATPLVKRPLVPVFDGPRITLQMVRIPQPPFSAALIAFLEATLGSDDEKNPLVAPIPMPDTVDDYPASQLVDFANRAQAARHPAVREWLSQSRLDGFSRLMAAVPPTDAPRQALLQRVRSATKASLENLARLAAASATAASG
jgi:hypothetical protein